jgi:DNA-binding MltR family transcriptional regulator
MNYKEILLSISGESDRGAAITSAAWIDFYLTKLLQKYCLPINQKKDIIFGNGGSVNDFSNKIDLCYRLGLINLNTNRSLHLIRKIRNEFAHTNINITFNNSHVKDRVIQAFSLHENIINYCFNLLNKKLPDDIYKVSSDELNSLNELIGTRLLFDITLSHMILAIMEYIELTNELTPQKYL